MTSAFGKSGSGPGQVWDVEGMARRLVEGRLGRRARVVDRRQL